MISYVDTATKRNKVDFLEEVRLYILNALFFFAVSCIAWPMMISDNFTKARFYLSIRFGFRERWLKYEIGESPGRVYVLSDKNEFATGVASPPGNNFVELSVIYLEDAKLKFTRNEFGNMQFRYRKIAPSRDNAPTEWESIPVEQPPTYEPDLNTDDEGDDDFVNCPKFHKELRLDRGKYEFEYRAKNDQGLFENFGSDFVIVSSPEDGVPK